MSIICFFDIFVKGSIHKNFIKYSRFSFSLDKRHILTSSGSRLQYAMHIKQYWMSHIIHRFLFSFSFVRHLICLFSSFIQNTHKKRKNYRIKCDYKYIFYDFLFRLPNRRRHLNTCYCDINFKLEHKSTFLYDSIFSNSPRSSPNLSLRYWKRGCKWWRWCLVIWWMSSQGELCYLRHTKK